MHVRPTNEINQQLFKKPARDVLVFLFANLAQLAYQTYLKPSTEGERAARSSAAAARAVRTTVIIIILVGSKWQVGQCLVG